MTAAENRKAVRDTYRTIIGRNRYSQSLRDYCYRKYKDGKYYSDCSSSICYTYEKCGLGFGILNTVGMWTSKQLTDVEVRISKGVIQNPEVLRVGDMLLFAGSDVSRSPWGYVGHVEMVGEISGGVVQLYGHGSGNPKRHEMNAYCRMRYASKTNTALGNKGLIRVRRLIQDDGQTPMKPEEDAKPAAQTRLGLRILKNGCVGEDVRELQAALIRLGFSCGSWGADGDFGDCTEMALRQAQKQFGLIETGIADEKTVSVLKARLAELDAPGAAGTVKIYGGNCYIRTEPDTSGSIRGVAKEGREYPYDGETTANGWLAILYHDKRGWVSGKYGRMS